MLALPAPHLHPVLPGVDALAQILILNQQLLQDTPALAGRRRLGLPPPSSTRSEDFLAAAARASRARLLS